MPDGTNDYEGIVLVPGPSAAMLNQRQLLDYRDHRRDLIQWHLREGRDPDRAVGYAESTVERRASDIDVWYRWVWERDGSYTTRPTQADTDDYMRHLAQTDYSDTHRANTQKSMKSYWRWRGSEWKPSIVFSSNDSATTPRDYFTRDERQQLENAALSYGTVDTGSRDSDSLTADQRRELAVRYRTPIEHVEGIPLQQANGFKVPSIVYTTLDAALRPIEVGRARVSWVDIENAVLRIPSDDSAKGREHWIVSLREQTSRMLSRWLDERSRYPKYADSDRLWLTREGEPHSSRTLNYLLDQLCDEAGIDTANRSLTWYAIRHSTGTYMTREDGLAAAASQLRHKSVTTTRKYDQTPAEDRRDALDSIHD